MVAPETIPHSLQDILPKWAHFCLFIEKFITKELGVSLKGKRLLVGVSGGVDSVALLMVLHYLSVRNDFKITAVHLDHQLRPESCDDGRWVASLCESIGIECVVESRSISDIADKVGIGLEEAGRNERYALFQSLKASKMHDFIFLAHHLDDLSEDVLMRLMRGTGWPGLSGMTGFDDTRSLVRPFLTTPKSTLKAFVKYLTIEWREDASNSDPTWMRNRIRNEVMPLFLKENPSFRESIARLWKIGRIEREYWDELSGQPLEELSNTLLSASHKAVRLRLYKTCLDDMGQGQALAHTLFKLDEAWLDRHLGAAFQFPGDKVATITSSGVVFSYKH